MQLLLAGNKGSIKSNPKWDKEGLDEWLRIEWQKKPEEWMLDAAIAFDAAMHHCSAPDDMDVKDRTVIHIRVFKESERPQNCNGTSLPPPGKGEHELVAGMMVKRVKDKPVLWTLVGDRLSSCGMLNFALAAAVCGLVALHIMEPGADKVKVPDVVVPEKFYNQTAVVVVGPNVFSLMWHIVFYAFALYFVFHQISKDMLKLATGFDSAVIVFSCAMTEAAVLHELIFHLSRAHKVLPAINIILYVARSLMRITSHYTVSIMDAWTFDKYGKMGVLIPFIVSLSFAYITQRFKGQWSTRETCMAFGECNTWKGVYLSFLKNEIIFAIKLLIPYMRGHQYAVLKFHAIDSEKELFKRHTSARASMALWLTHSVGASRFRGSADPHHTSVMARQSHGSTCPSEGVASVCLYGKANEKLMSDGRDGDLLENEEIVQDDECLHHIPNPGQSSRDALGGSYFSRAELQVNVTR